MKNLNDPACTRHHVSLLLSSSQINNRMNSLCRALVKQYFFRLPQNHPRKRCGSDSVLVHSRTQQQQKRENSRFYSNEKVVARVVTPSNKSHKITSVGICWIELVVATRSPPEDGEDDHGKGEENLV